MAVDSLHVVQQVVVAGKAVSGQCAVTALVLAAVGFLAMAVQSMCLALVTKEAGR